MADAFIQMVGQIDDCDPYRYAEVLWVKLLALEIWALSEESMKTAFEMISLLENDHSNSAKNLMSLAYEKLGWQVFQVGVRLEDKSESSAKIQLAITYYEKYKELAMFVGNMVQDCTFETP